ncbi:hypothetical protein C7A12_06985 [Pseudomonas fluorescens]|uniref:Uncharacterized protein n=1 Tax=Pseudomonas fluorescens TaxID=294 RepID=A0A2T0ID97_PSEFL|nr:hypothetical protein C7A12_06985 [Pseudomonas fluorescens]PRW82144.1 hypothetical protein C7A13_02665 [Pseudomonas fluorescens]PRW93310.1 hypothetical protein C7A10_09065 [Pseudomonas fluorescens]
MAGTFEKNECAAGRPRKRASLRESKPEDDCADDRSRARRGNAASDAPRPVVKAWRGAPQEAFPRRAWERSGVGGP